MKKKLSAILEQTLQDCFKKGTLERVDLPDYVIEVPNHPEHGHFATNLPLVLAPLEKRPPREIARAIVDSLAVTENMLADVSIAGPGFINFIVAQREWHRLLMDIIREDERYGRSDFGRNRRIMVEFVSANPTGPLHLGHGRGAALGDTLSRVLAFNGYEVVREFYVNDAGLQIRLLGESIYCRWKRTLDPDYPFPENGYQGEYISALADEIPKKTDLNGLDKEEAISLCADLGKKKMLEEIRKDLQHFRVVYDVWSHESDLLASGMLDSTLNRMKSSGELYESEGAFWIRTAKYGDDKDRVVKKSDGQFTYFATDISYHLDKWKRGFSRVINIWGADHHGYVQRMKSALKANQIDENWLAVLLIQLVKLYEGGREIRMSKRAGQYVTLKDLVDEVGVDAARFVFLSKSHDSPIDFDIDLVKKHDSDNPVYYVQYAHARICSIFRKAAEEGIHLPEKPLLEDLTPLHLDEELGLIRLMAGFPSLVEEIGRRYEPHRLTFYLTELAAAFHKYFNMGNQSPEHRIVGRHLAVSQARLFLAGAVRVVLRNGLALLGVTAPERM